MKKESIQIDAQYSKKDLCVFEQYSFCCSKMHTSDKKFEIYKVNQHGSTKLFDGKCELLDEDDSEDILIEEYLDANVLPSLPNHGMISGAHMVIDLSDKSACNLTPFRSANLCMNIIARASKKFHKDLDFSIQFNDLYIEQDNSRDDNNVINKYRVLMFSPFVIPTRINELLIRTSREVERDLDLYYFTSKNLADKFKRHIKNKKKTDPRFHFKDGDWYYQLHGREVLILHGDKPNCACANAAMLKDVRFDVDHLDVKDNYYSYIGVYPMCSKRNILDGCEIGYDFYKEIQDLDTYIIFYGDTCL